MENTLPTASAKEWRYESGEQKRYQTNDSLRAGKTCGLLRLPDDPRLSRQLERVPAFKMDKEQPGVWIDRDIPERVEHIIPRIIWKKQFLSVYNLNEARIAAAMGGVRAAFWMETGNKEGIGQQDPILLFSGKMRSAF